MHILIDKSQWRMIAAAPTLKHINLVAYVDFPNADKLVVDSQESRTWSVVGETEMGQLYRNMSGLEPPEYSECIKQLASYGDTWPAYSKSEAQLEREAEAIYQAEEAEKSDEDHRHEAKVAMQQMREAHQASIEAAEAHHKAANPSAYPQASKPAEPAPTKPKPEGEPRPRQGITKKIWEIADELLAVTGQIGNIKEFRSEVIKRAKAQHGANEGTAATQFGKWKASKGF